MKENLVQKLDSLEAQLARIEARKEDGTKLQRTKHLLERLEKSGNVLPGRQQLVEQIAETKHEIVNRKKFYAETVVKRAVKQFVKVEPSRIAKRKKTQDGNAEKSAVLDAELALVQSSDVDNWSHDIVERFMHKRFETEFEKRALSPPETNVLARIRKTEPVRKASSQLEDAVTVYIEGENAASTKNNAKNNDKSTKKDEKAENTAKEDTPKGKEPEKTEDDFAKFESESEHDESEEENEEPQMDPFFQQEVGLPELYQGYISGSEDESEPEETEKPARRNRRGQRARRKIWEQKFGHRANHVIKQEQQEREEQEQKEQKKRKREEKQMAIKRQKQEFAAKPVHPSWAAHQKLKEQQKAAQFQGKKIQFD